MKSIVTYQAKGGNFKTSLSGTIGQILADKHKTIVIDCDHQGNLTTWLTGNDPSIIKYEFADALQESCEIEDAIFTIGKLHLLGTIAGSGKINTYTENRLNNETEIMLEVKDFLYDQGYEYVIWDLSPSFNLMNRCVIVQADSILSPLSPEYFSLAGLVNLFNSVDELAKKKKRIRGVNIPKPTIAISGYNQTVRQHREVKEAIEKKVERVASIMPVDPIYRKAQAVGVSIFDVIGEKPKKETVEGLQELIGALV